MKNNVMLTCLIRAQAIAATMLLLGFIPIAIAAPSSWEVISQSKAPEDQRAVNSVMNMERSIGGMRKICIVYGKAARGKKDMAFRRAAEAYLEEQGGLIGSDIRGARAKSPAIGMSACGVFAALGEPDAINITERADKKDLQIVYRARRTYIYARGTTSEWNPTVYSVSY